MYEQTGERNLLETTYIKVVRDINILLSYHLSRYVFLSLIVVSIDSLPDAALYCGIFDRCHALLIDNCY